MTPRVQMQHYQQTAEGYCLAACVRMVLNHQGRHHTEAEVRHVLGSRTFGTPGFAVKRLSQWQVEVTYREWSIAQVLDALDAAHPIIIFVRTAFLDHWKQDVAHAVVLIGYEEGRHFWLHDPALPNGPTKVSWHGVLASWAEFDYRGAALSA